MAAKSYVLGAALRPFTVYDAEWELVCLLCVRVPSIEEGGAVPVDLPGGKKGIDITFTIRPDGELGQYADECPAELIASAPLLAIYPGMMIFLTVISCNLLGDALHERLDPRLAIRT